MRKAYHIRLRKHFHRALIETRERRELSQAQMAEMLAMDERSYIDLDHGKTCCSAVTLVLFLIYVCEDVDKFLLELKRALEESQNKAA